MKKRIKRTGEIVDVLTYTAGTERSKLDNVRYIDGNGNEISSHLNYYWDFEDFDEDDEIGYWEKFRHNAALKIMAAISSNFTSEKMWEEKIDVSVRLADKLIEKLKGKQ